MLRLFTLTNFINMRLLICFLLVPFFSYSQNWEFHVGGSYVLNTSQVEIEESTSTLIRQLDDEFEEQIWRTVVERGPAYKNVYIADIGLGYRKPISDRISYKLTGLVQSRVMERLDSFRFIESEILSSRPVEVESNGPITVLSDCDETENSISDLGPIDPATMQNSLYLGLEAELSYKLIDQLTLSGGLGLKTPLATRQSRDIFSRERRDEGELTVCRWVLDRLEDGSGTFFRNSVFSARVSLDYFATDDISLSIAYVQGLNDHFVHDTFLFSQDRLQAQELNLRVTYRMGQQPQGSLEKGH